MIDKRPPASPRSTPPPRRDFKLLGATTVAEKIRAVQEDARILCWLAIDQTPAKYRTHIVLIEQRKKVGEDERGKLVFAEIALPYMSVDGRVVMAQDEHREAGKTYRLRTQFLTGPTGEVLCRATLISPLRGVAMGHVKVVVSPSGVNFTNPYENAETSAIGRCLGNAGYGVFGVGIASAEEVLAALKPRGAGANGHDAPARAPTPHAPARGPRAPRPIQSDGERTVSSPEGAGASSPDASTNGEPEIPSAGPAEQSAQSTFSQINARFEQLKTPAFQRVSQMKEYRGRETELLTLLDAKVRGPQRTPSPTGGGRGAQGELEADEVPF